MNTLLIWSSHGVTDKGKVRTANEDAIIHLPELGLWAVADGMGGHEGGEIASQTIVSELGNLTEPHDFNEFMRNAYTAIQRANQNILDTSAQRFDGKTIGSTVVVVLAFNNQFGCLWAGDSRAYLLRRNQLIQITKDHSMVQEYVDSGRMTEEEAENHAMANVLTRAVGTAPDLEIDHQVGEIHQNDTCVLCSDGLYKELTVDDIQQILEHESHPQAAGQALMALALERGARDNVSVIVIKFQEAFN